MSLRRSYGMLLIKYDRPDNLELPIKGYAAHQNCSWQGNKAAAFVRMAHHRIDVATGTLRTEEHRR